VFATAQSGRPGPARGRRILSRPPLSPTVPRHLLSSPVVFLPLLSSSVVLCRPPPSSAVFRCFPASPTITSGAIYFPTVPWQKLSQVIGLIVLANNSHPGNSRMKTDGILPPSLIQRSWQSPWTAQNTGLRSFKDGADFMGEMEMIKQFCFCY